MALCEELMLRTSAEARNLGKMYIGRPLADRLFLAYLPSLPEPSQDGLRAAAELVRYYIVTGFLFRTWIVHKMADDNFSGQGTSGSASDIGREL